MEKEIFRKKFKGKKDFKKLEPGMWNTARDESPTWEKNLVDPDIRDAAAMCSVLIPAILWVLARFLQKVLMRVKSFSHSVKCFSKFNK